MGVKPAREIQYPRKETNMQTSVPFFDGKDITSYPQADRFLQRLATPFVLEKRDLVHLKRELWMLGAGKREKRGKCSREN
jgi:hypothetical protein